MSRSKCSVVECKEEVVARGLCRLHYERLTRSGTLENPRPKDWGKRTEHSLYESWRWMIRSRMPMCEEWRKDFWRFVQDVGERPSAKHRCWRLDETKPYGAQNFFWREVVFAKERTESEKEYRARYMREWAKLNSDKARSNDLKKHYGITLEQYNAMLEAQGGVCAICGGVNDMKDHRTGKLRNLSVDHCHAEGHVRKLLCQYCNQGLGNFKDSAVLLRKAALYLEQRENGETTKSQFEREHYRLIDRPGLQAMMRKWWDDERSAMTEVDMAKKAKKGKTPMRGSGKQGC